MQECEILHAGMTDKQGTTKPGTLRSSDAALCKESQGVMATLCSHFSSCFCPFLCLMQSLRSRSHLLSQHIT